MTRWLVVGGGSSGCVVAARLSEVASNDVTLLEAGPDHGMPAARHNHAASNDAGVTRRPSGPTVPYAQGHGLGGSSLINGAIVVGDSSDWTQGHALPVEAPVVGPVGNAVLAATSDAAIVGSIGRSGERRTAADVYVRPVLDRSNLSVRSGVGVDRVVFDGHRVVGAVAQGQEIAADRVVLCAGAIESPAILLRSGVEAAGVGEGLQDHVGVAFSFDIGATDDRAAPIAVTVERPGRQLVVLERLEDHPAMGALLAGHLDVTSRGAVTLAADGSTAVSLNQLATVHDRDGLALVARETLELLRLLQVAGTIGRVFADEYGTGIDALHDDAALRRWLPDHLAGYHHVAGSCHGALTGDGWLRGYEGLAVSDASALPGPPGHNPYLSVIRHAETMCHRWVSLAGE